jgi:hypothetical protein
MLPENELGFLTPFAPRFDKSLAPMASHWFMPMCPIS